MEQVRYLYLTISEWITVAAIILGPVLAVMVTRWIDETKIVRERQVNVLRALMKTRQARLDGEHVAALNLVELEFYNSGSVVACYRAYMESLNQRVPNEQDDQDRFLKKRGALFAALVQTTAKCLGYGFDKLDLDQGGYYPSGWGNDLDRQRKNSELLTEILEGRRAFPVFHLQHDQGKFPPKP